MHLPQTISQRMSSCLKSVSKMKISLPPFTQRQIIDVWAYGDDDFPQSRIIAVHVWIVMFSSGVDSQTIFTMLLSAAFVLQNIRPDFDEDEGELQINFIKNRGIFRRRPKRKPSKVEIVITPQESPEGIKILVEGYERMLKRQFS